MDRAARKRARREEAMDRSRSKIEENEEKLVAVQRHLEALRNDHSRSDSTSPKDREQRKVEETLVKKAEKYEKRIAKYTKQLQVCVRAGVLSAPSTRDQTGRKRRSMVVMPSCRVSEI